jgi:hypothetical protein
MTGNSRVYERSCAVCGNAETVAAGGVETVW